jgi:hypothetical protein
MDAAVWLSALSPATRQFVQCMQHLNYGRFGPFQVRSGEPVLDPSVKIVREIKFGSDNDPRPEAAHQDFVVKRRVLEMVQQLKAIGNGTVQCLVVKAGLPFQMIVEESRR